MTLLGILEEYLGLDIAACYALPPEAYTDEDLHRLELDAIFKREWLCVGRDEYVKAPGDYYCIDILDEPVLVVRGEDGTVRTLANICRHRYMPVAQGAGNTKRFVCPYHAWSYATDGRLTAAPFMDGSTVFDKSKCTLKSYRCETWRGFLFINLDETAPPLADRMRSVDEAIANYRIEDQTEIMRYQTEWAGNWKLSAENSMEYYHHVGLHKDTVGGQLPAKNTIPLPSPEDGSFTHERCRMHSKYIGGRDHPFNPKGRLDTFTEEELHSGYMVYIFPAFTMAMRPNANNWLSFSPAGIGNTRVLGGYLVSNEVARDYPNLADERRDLILAVNEEDALATTELAKAMRSVKAERGPLSPFESTLADFYRYLARSLGGIGQRHVGKPPQTGQ